MLSSWRVNGCDGGGVIVVAAVPALEGRDALFSSTDLYAKDKLHGLQAGFSTGSTWE